MSNCFGFSNIVIPVTGLSYKGLWDADTNNPTLQSGVGISGDYYIVSVAGTTDLDGITDWEVNDWAIFDGTAWQKIDNSQFMPTLQQVTDAGNTTSNPLIVSDGVNQSQVTENQVSTGQIKLDIIPTGTNAVGVTRWNDTNGVSETLLKGNSVILKNGIDLVARVVNKVTPNATLTKASYPVVRVSGAQGQRLAVAYAQANNDNNSADTLGVVIETIATNQEGFIMTVGQIEHINTTGSLQGETWADGDVLYLSSIIPGAITNIKPTAATAHIVIIGYVEYAHANNGKIYVKIMNGWELDELHNVYINPATLANNDALIYDSSIQLWKNNPVTESVISLSDVTTNNVSTTKHGFAPKLPNDATKFLDGKGNYTSPPTGLTVGTTAVTSGIDGRVFFQFGGLVQQDAAFFWDNTNKRLGVGATPNSSVRLDVRAQGALSTDIAFRVRNSADTADLISFRGDGSQWIQSVPFIHAGSLTGTTNAAQSLHIGYNAAALNSASSNSITIGRGTGASLAGNNNVSIGNANSIGGFSSMLGIGLGVQMIAANTAFIGSETFPYSTMWVSTGGEVSSGANLRGLDFRVSGCAGGLTNQSASGVQVRFFSPNGTGSGAGSNIQFHVAPSNTGGSAFNRNIFSEMFTIRGEADGLNHYQLATPRVPSTSITNGYIQYSNDITAGNAAPHFRTENGAIVKVYQETTAVAASTLVGNAGANITDTDTFDGYTLKQIVKALRNQGLLA